MRQPCCSRSFGIGDERLDLARQLPLEVVLVLLGVLDDFAHPPVFERAELVDMRAHEDVRRVGGHHVGDERVHHDLRRPEPDVERLVVDLVEAARGIAVDIDADEDVALGRRLVEGQGIDHAAVDQQVIGVGDQPEQSRDGDRARDGRPQRP